MITFGSRLRELRKGQGINQRDLAYQAGIDFTYISKLENEQIPPPSVLTIHRLARALEADDNELLALAGKIPAGLPQLLKENPLLVELVHVLSERILPDEVYRQLIALAQESEVKT